MHLVKGSHREIHPSIHHLCRPESFSILFQAPAGSKGQPRFSFSRDRRFECALLSVIQAETKSSEFSGPILRYRHPAIPIASPESDLFHQLPFQDGTIYGIIVMDHHSSKLAKALSQTCPQCWPAALPASYYTTSWLHLISIPVQPQLPFSCSVVSHSDGRSSASAASIAESFLASTSTVNQ